MKDHRVPPALLRAWLTARSIARGLPLPVADSGGWRVDTASGAEVARWVYARPEPGLKALAQSITEPRHLIKLCGRVEDFRAALPQRWTIRSPGYFMRTARPFAAVRLPGGYQLDVSHEGPLVAARVLFADGGTAASGFAVEAGGVFIYDRILTDPLHRRKGLGTAIMAALQSARRSAASEQVLVATAEGRSLYQALGWDTVSPYLTASIDPA